MTLRSALAKFLPDEHSKRLFVPFVCFVIAAFGAAMGFAADALELRWLGQIAFVITAIAVVVGGAAVFWLLIGTFAKKQ